jgi:hypothetical protein
VIAAIATGQHESEYLGLPDSTSKSDRTLGLLNLAGFPVDQRMLVGIDNSRRTLLKSLNCIWWALKDSNLSGEIE